MDQPRSRHVPNTMSNNTVQLSGLRWHGVISVVGTPNHGYGHAFVAPPRIWRRGIRNGTRPLSSTGFWKPVEERGWVPHMAPACVQSRKDDES